MDDNYGENLKQALVTLQDSLNELIKNTYLSGFQDGQELGFKMSGKEADTLGDDNMNNLVSGFESQKSNVLLEAEKILKEYS